jgi:hypothetical protein
MRIWSLHPQYLDPQGLVALWRETLLAQKVLRGETRGYRNHPQLNRFKAARDPLAAISHYLGVVCDEAERRGYSFDRSKIHPAGKAARITVTSGQIDYEWQHLLAKLAVRNPDCHEQWRNVTKPVAHPLFIVRNGAIADWERLAEQ